MSASNRNTVGRSRPVESPVPADLLADVLWQRVGHTSLEHCRLSRRPGIFVLQGVLLARTESDPQQIHYAVSCGMDWTTQAVHVTVIEGAHVRRLQLERDQLGIWRRDSEILSEFEGLADVDLQTTPATNTLPIRRLRLGVGDSAETDALWIRFPELRLERLPQRYTRTTEFLYMYESQDGAFRAELEVDAEGVVVRYGNIWKRV
jgi:uncharacterized protein